jgi:hypothetical protein
MAISGNVSGRKALNGIGGAAASKWQHGNNSGINLSRHGVAMAWRRAKIASRITIAYGASRV